MEIHSYSQLAPKRNWRLLPRLKRMGKHTLALAATGLILLVVVAAWPYIGRHPENLRLSTVGSSIANIFSSHPFGFASSASVARPSASRVKGSRPVKVNFRDPFFGMGGIGLGRIRDDLDSMFLDDYSFSPFFTNDLGNVEELLESREAARKEYQEAKEDEWRRRELRRIEARRVALRRELEEQDTMHQELTRQVQARQKQLLKQQKQREEQQRLKQEAAAQQRPQTQAALQPQPGQTPAAKAIDIESMGSKDATRTLASHTGGIHSVPALHRDEKEDSYSFTLDTQGLDRNNLRLEMQGNVIIVEGKKMIETDNGYYSSTFQRSFPMPPDADLSSLRSQESNGQLTISASKMAPTQPASAEPKAAGHGPKNGAKSAGLNALHQMGKNEAAARNNDDGVVEDYDAKADDKEGAPMDQA